MSLPLECPYPLMEAESADTRPAGPEWQYEPKWDGFRCLAFRDGDDVRIQSKAGKPLGRYFPDLVASLAELAARRFVLDGEIVIPVDGALSFDELLLGVHPAESRVRSLSRHPQPGHGPPLARRGKRRPGRGDRPAARPALPVGGARRGADFGMAPGSSAGAPTRRRASAG